MKRPSLTRLATPAALTALVALLVPLAASANTISLLGSITSASPASTWAYNLELSADQDVQIRALAAGPSVSSQNLGHGSFLTTFDFVGYVDVACTSPTGLACMVQNVGFTPSASLPEDEPEVVNLTWQPAAGASLGGEPNGASLGVVSALVGTAIPEPGSLALASLALVLLGGGLRRRRRDSSRPSQLQLEALQR